MNKTKSKLINDFYDLCELLDDDFEMVSEFLKNKCNSKQRQLTIIKHMENGRYHKIISEIDKALDHPLLEFKQFKEATYNRRQLEKDNGLQLVIDFNI